MIFYFSGTGNTRWAAKALAEATGEQLVYIPEAMLGDCNYMLQPNERIGFVFPVHGWRPPKIVRSFIGRLGLLEADYAANEQPSPLSTRHYCYTVCTAGDTVGEAISILEHDIAPLGIRLAARFSLIMPESYVGLPFMDVDKKAKEQEKKARAAEELRQYAQRIVAREAGDGHITVGRWPRINSRLIGSVFVNHLVTDKPFHVVANRCVKCGICADVCPVGDVIGGLGLEPRWKHDGSCLSCFTCYHHCPHHAIEYGTRTKHKGQYFYNKR